MSECLRVLVCGGRDFIDGDFVFSQLSSAFEALRFKVLIHGGARGADSLADAWARGAGVEPCKCEALWQYYRMHSYYKEAGPRRNAAMLVLQPQLVIAFPGGNGTRDMVNTARAEGIPVRDMAVAYARLKEPQ